MAGFPQLPDALRTNRSLLQMRPKWRGYATSDPRKGVHLTEKGKNEVARVIDVIGAPTFNGQTVSVAASDVDPRTEHREKKRTYDPHDTVKKIRTGILFRRYRDQRNEETGVVHLLGLLELYDHTPASEMRKKFHQLEVDAETVKDREVTAFLDAVKERFQDYLNRQEVKRGNKHVD